MTGPSSATEAGKAIGMAVGWLLLSASATGLDSIWRHLPLSSSQHFLQNCWYLVASRVQSVVWKTAPQLRQGRLGPSSSVGRGEGCTTGVETGSHQGSPVGGIVSQSSDCTSSAGGGIKVGVVGLAVPGAVGVARRVCLTFRESGKLVLK